MTPFTRDGHLSDLGLELVMAGEVEEPAADEHLSQCGPCRARLEEARQVTAPAPPAARRPTAANRPWAWLGAAGLLAAGLLAWVLVPTAGQAPGDGLRIKGGGLTLQVVRDGPEGPEVLRSGGEVHPGERLGFAVASRQAGELMVLAVDEQGTIDLCYPQGSYVSAPAHPGELRPLPDAVALDGVLGEARFVAVRCSESFDLEEARAMVTGTVPATCVASSVSLRKVAK